MTEFPAHRAPDGLAAAPPPLRLLLPRPQPAVAVRLRPGLQARPGWRPWWRRLRVLVLGVAGLPG